MAKNIVFCADGTCNGPGETDDTLLPSDTNVYKLYVRLCSRAPADPGSNEQEASETDAAGTVVQSSRYINGVGDSGGPVERLFGSAVGAGLAARIVRGYTYLSRVYDPGDAIFLVGFSRGAYTVRALAGLVLFSGLMDRSSYDSGDKSAAYALAAGAWYRYQQTVAVNGGWLGTFDKIIAGLPGIFTTPPGRYIPVDSIRAIGVWDTVSSYLLDAAAGNDGDKSDLLPLANTRLSLRVQRGFQAVSLDERRNVFTPVLWDAAANVVQGLFPGGHCDVGGGYSESGLSDGALVWMLDKLSSQGLMLYPSALSHPAPDPAGPAHQQWLYSPWTRPVFTCSTRSFAGRTDILPDSSIAAREHASAVVFDTGTSGTPQRPGPITGIYRPANLP
ncbi:MAG: DUF2235 domain-containing protein [Telmatospirillum sp.]|nr:DUF2235 domain-containing protein [Telmatospirillum sp.]